MNARNSITIRKGEVGRAVMPYSEVCMHMQVAGKRMRFLLLDTAHPMVQLLCEDRCGCARHHSPDAIEEKIAVHHKCGTAKTDSCDWCLGTGYRLISMPITCGEAGVYLQNAWEYYYYTDQTPERKEA